MRRRSGSTTSPKWVVRTVDLEAQCAYLAASIADLDEVWLFGSRRHGTRSRRSDIDLLITLRDDARVDLSTIVNTRAREPYLDCFSVVGDTAVSLANESRIRAGSWDELVRLLDAERVWAKGTWVGPERHRVHEVLANYEPAMTIAALGYLTDPAGPQVDAILITALREEYDALLDVIGRNRGKAGESELIALTRSSSPPFVVRVQCIGRMGPIESAAAAVRSLMETPAGYILLVGLTAGVQGMVSLGDIVVPRTIYDYELARVADGKTRRRVEPYKASRELVGVAQNVARNFTPSVAATEVLPSTSNGVNLRVHSDAVMVSGAKVIADGAAAVSLTEWHGKAAAIEMEAAGVGAAADAVGTPFLVVKSVSDWADDSKNDEWRMYASRVAAEFVVKILRALPT
jgi:nucleoside phosphorylase